MHKINIFRIIFPIGDYYLLYANHHQQVISFGLNFGLNFKPGYIRAYFGLNETISPANLRISRLYLDVRRYPEIL